MTDRIQRDLDVPVAPATLWHALTDPATLRDWLADDVALELEPGGEASFLVDGQRRTGWVEEVCPPHADGPGRLVFWWQAGGESASRVEFELTPTAAGSRLRITESRPLEILDLVGIPVRGAPGTGGSAYGPALVAA